MQQLAALGVVENLPELQAHTPVWTLAKLLAQKRIRLHHPALHLAKHARLRQLTAQYDALAQWLAEPTAEERLET